MACRLWQLVLMTYCRSVWCGGALRGDLKYENNYSKYIIGRRRRKLFKLRASKRSTLSGQRILVLMANAFIERFTGGRKIGWISFGYLLYFYLDVENATGVIFVG